jgi:hypothetical protein
MREVVPKRPQNLNPYARELLDALQGHSEAADIVLGGGVALSHYLEYRGTVDADAWWRKEANAVTRRLLQATMESHARKHGLEHRLRVWGDTESYELIDGKRKAFSFQISTRTRYLDAPRMAPWPPLMLETLRDNVASKMTALVERGAPRDLRDIYELCTRDFVSIEECWKLWQMKNDGRDLQEGRAKVLFHVQRLELQRPLDTIATSAERAGAAAVRQWFTNRLCADGAP